MTRTNPVDIANGLEMLDRMHQERLGRYFGAYGDLPKKLRARFYQRDNYDPGCWSVYTGTTYVTSLPTRTQVKKWAKSYGFHVNFDPVEKW